jgi:hypothetical protein
MDEAKSAKKEGFGEIFLGGQSILLKASVIKIAVSANSAPLFIWSGNALAMANSSVWVVNTPKIRGIPFDDGPNDDDGFVSRIFHESAGIGNGFYGTGTGKDLVGNLLLSESVNTTL